jgi:ribulose-5-phosphate 4-epimerase/fuculose-1-phosphate aldolase
VSGRIGVSVAAPETVHTDGEALRETVALACRVLAARGLVDGILGHVSARVGHNEMVVRCRGRGERGLRASTANDVWRVSFDGRPIDVPEEYAAPNELPIHGELLRCRPDLGAVVHAHPPAALLCGLAGLAPRPVFGAYNIPALRMARAGVPVFDRPVLIRTRALALEMVNAMGESPVCLLRGHGITVAARTVEQATVAAINLNTLLEVTVEQARLGIEPPELTERDLAELPDLGSAFNDQLAWQALVTELKMSAR